MPLFRYSCTNEKCKASFAIFKKSAKDALPIELCKKCGSESKRILSVPNSSSKISIDNGLQPRAIEVDPNIMELREDWSKPPNRGD